MLDYTFLANTTLQWLLAGGTAVLAFAVLYGLKSLLVRRIAAIASRTATRVDDLLAETLTATRLPVIVIMALYAGSTLLTLRPDTELVLSRIAVATGLIQAALWGDRAVRAWLQQYRASPLTDPGHATSTAAIGFIVRTVVWAVFLLMILDNLGVNITTLVASLGIGGIAVALAVQNILGDLFASLSIVLDKPFVIGDFIIVDGIAGTVEYVGLKTTRLRSLNGEQLIFSNTDLLGSRIHNFKRMETRRVVFQIGVTYGTPDATVAEIPGLIEEIVRQRADVRFDRAHFSGFGASSLDFEVVYIVNSPDYGVHMDARQQIFLDIYRAFNQRGIDFAFPTQTLHLVSEAPLEVMTQRRGEQPPAGIHAVRPASGGAAPR
jgi:small-conductance mechanosensitive channel